MNEEMCERERSGEEQSCASLDYRCTTDLDAFFWGGAPIFTKRLLYLKFELGSIAFMLSSEQMTVSWQFLPPKKCCS